MEEVMSPLGKTNIPVPTSMINGNVKESNQPGSYFRLAIKRSQVAGAGVEPAWWAYETHEKPLLDPAMTGSR